MPQKKVDLEARKVIFTLEVPKDAPEGTTGQVIEFDLSKVTPDMVVQLALHGASQKLGDSYAGAKESGEDPIAYARDSLTETMKQLYSEEHGGLNSWKVARSGGGTPRTSILVQAFALVAGVSIEDAQEKIGALTDEEKKAVSAQKKIVAAMAQIRAEQAVARAKKAAEEAAKEEAAAAGATA